MRYTIRSLHLTIKNIMEKELSIEKERQQNVFEFDKVVFSSRFDSGNLKNVVKVNDQNVINV